MQGAPDVKARYDLTHRMLGQTLHWKLAEVVVRRVMINKLATVSDGTLYCEAYRDE